MPHCYISMSLATCRKVLDCASPLALLDSNRSCDSGRGLPHSKTLSRSTSRLPVHSLNARFVYCPNSNPAK